MFRRSHKTEAVPEADVEKVGGKGRPTPKRNQAEAARKQRMTPPRTRKEANAIRKERVSRQRQEMRTAMETGDERGLPARDRGRLKRLARNFVDSRRTIAEFLIPIVAVVFVLSLMHNRVAWTVGNAVLLGSLIATIVNSVLLVRGFKRLAAERYPGEDMKGISMYVLMRSWQMRRMRLPKAQVKVGDQV